MKIRSYQEKDLPELVALRNEALRGSYEFIPRTLEGLREELEQASLVLVAADEAGRIEGFAVLRHKWYGEEVELYVPPGRQELGLKERLLAAIEREAQAAELVAAVDSGDREQLQFFTSQGYQPEGSLYQLTIMLDRPRPIPAVSPGYRLRGLRPDEEEALIRVVNAAYGGERLRPGALARWHQEDPDFGPEWVQVAEYAGELVAAVVARTDREFNAYYGAKRAYLGPAATLPEHRGRGLNKALTARLLEFLRGKGFEMASLHTWSGNAVALKVLKGLGFRLSHEWRILRRHVR